MGKALFITGTGTDIGKTYVTGLIVKRLKEAGLCAGYYKAALSGAETSADGSLLPGDALHVARTAALAEDEAIVSYIYRRISPRESKIVRSTSARSSVIFARRRSVSTI